MGPSGAGGPAAAGAAVVSNERDPGSVDREEEDSPLFPVCLLEPIRSHIGPSS